MTTLKGFESLDSSLIPTSLGCSIHAYYTPPSSQVGADGPVLVLLHGYPESKYIWRHMLPELKDRFRVFVPDLPGYGLSTPFAPETPTSRHAVGAAVLEALASLFPSAQLLLIGHDRGARTWQKVASDFTARDKSPEWATYPAQVRDLSVLGVQLVDIVPYIDQWSAFQSGRAAAVYFHWPLLATGDLAFRFIKGYGSAQFTLDLLARVTRPGSAEAQSFQADGAWAHYAEHFARDEVLQASIDDYVAGATVDVDTQRADVEGGRLIGVPVLVQCTVGYLGKVFDLERVWSRYVSGEWVLERMPEGVGHHVPEERPELVLQGLERLLGMVGRGA